MRLDCTVFGQNNPETADREFPQIYQVIIVHLASMSLMLHYR